MKQNVNKYRAEPMKEVFTKKVIEELRTQGSLLLVVEQSNNNSQPRKKESNNTIKLISCKLWVKMTRKGCIFNTDLLQYCSHSKRLLLKHDI